MTTRTVSNSGGNFNSGTTWVEGIVPTIADDVVFTVTSGNLNITANAVCRSYDETNWIGTLTHGSFSLSIGNATGGNLKMVTGATYTPTTSTSCRIILVSTAAACNITTVGKTLRNLNFNSWKCLHIFFARQLSFKWSSISKRWKF